VLEKKSHFKAWLYLAPAMLLLGVFTFYPLFNAFYLAFLEDFSYLDRTATGFTLFGNFIEVITDVNFKRALINTSYIVFISVPISVIVALFISVALNSIKKFQSLLQTIFFLPYVTNAIAVGMAFAFIFHTDYGLFNMLLGAFGIDPINWVGAGASWGTAMFALLVYTVWGGLAFKIMVFLSGLQSIDKQYYDAARVDSTPRWRVFTRITVPLLSPMIAYITITSFIGAFKAYRTIVGMFGPTLRPPGALSKDSLITIVGLVYDAMDKADQIGAMSEAAATSIILFLITLAFTGLQMIVSRKRVHY
jgi:multiple sugar transport system permease protein